MDGSDTAHRGRLTRRALLRAVGAGSVASLGLRRAGTARAAAGAELPDDALPPDLGQADLQVYLEATGHTLRGSFLDYWRANGAAAIYGNPISEPFAGVDGFYSQAFERGVFQYRPEFLDTADPIMRLMPIGRIALLDRLGAFPSRPQLRLSDAPDPIWRPLDATDYRAAAALDAGGVFVAATGHTIGGDILAWYRFNEGAFYLGPPLTEPLSNGRTTVQWFAGGALTAGPRGVFLAPLGADLAARLGIDTSPVPRDDLPRYDEQLFSTASNPNPMGDPAAPGAKWVEVSIAEQRLWAYQGMTLISTTLVSTGLDPNLTALGMFHVRLKYPEQDMRGFTDATGEVLGFGDAPPGASAYDVPAVPNVMYFDMEGEALHGTYWHNNFGQKMSHGCVNLPLDFAAWLYGWAPLGTGVWIHE